MQNKLKYLIGRCLCIGLLAGLVISCAALPGKTPAPAPVSPDAIEYPPLRFALPEAERIELPSGAIVYFLENRELPLVELSATLRSGSMYDPPGKEGVATLTAHLLRTGGTQETASDELDSRLDALAASASFGMSLDSASASASFLKSDLEACMTLFSQMLLRPAFEDKKLALARSLKREELRRIGDNPQRLAFREFNRLMYPDDPRGRYMTSASLNAITRDDLVAFHTRFFFPANMIWAVSGDLSREDAIAMMNRYFGHWPNRAEKFGLPPRPKNEVSGLYLITKPLPQSTVVSGEFTLGSHDPDYYAFTVLDFIIGSGGFPSRIFSAVRNNEGLAYSAGSFYRARPTYGVFGTYVFTKTESTEAARELIASILNDAVAGAITDAELAWAKEAILQSFIFSFEHPAQIVSQQMELAFDAMPDNYLNMYRQNIEVVSLNDLKRVAQKHLDGASRLTLILGDTDNIGPLPKSLGKPVYITPQQ